MGPLTRCRSHRKGKGNVCEGDPRKARHRKRNGNNRSNKLKAGIYDRPGGKQPVVYQPQA